MSPVPHDPLKLPFFLLCGAIGLLAAAVGVIAVARGRGVGCRG
jgi:hypothetical protein